MSLIDELVHFTVQSVDSCVREAAAAAAAAATCEEAPVGEVINCEMCLETRQKLRRALGLPKTQRCQHPAIASTHRMNFACLGLN